MTAQETLQQHAEACEHACEILLEENNLLRDTQAPPPPAFLDRKRKALQRLDTALQALRGLRELAGPDHRPLAQKAQRLVLKALLLDRENEQLLRKIAAPQKPDAPKARPTLDQIRKLYTGGRPLSTAADDDNAVLHG